MIHSIKSNTSTILVSILILISKSPYSLAFSVPSKNGSISSSLRIQHGDTKKLRLTMASEDKMNNDVEVETIITPRRSFINQAISMPLATVGLLSNIDQTNFVVNAAETSVTSTANAEITSEIFLELKGLPNSESDGVEGDIITIGLFGKDAPQPVSILNQLVSSSGYPSKCKPKETRALQREQLEANKVYNSCMETQDTKGVNYDLSTVWRIVKDEKIDLGAVSGKFIAREYPMFEGKNSLKHDAEGVVSVRLGNDGGFGFTIYMGPGSGSSDNYLNETNIVVGRVIGGIDVVRKLNEVPVIQSSSVGYKALAGGDPSKRSAPSRACRYGSSELYCNEFKPLKKITIFRTGVVN